MVETLEESITIGAPREHVWKILADLDGVTAWFAPLTASRTEGTGKGAARALTFADGLKLVETITAWEPGKTLAYDVSGMEPIAPRSTWSLEDAGQGTKVGYRMYIAGPPDAAKEGAAKLRPVIQLILASLKHHVETGGKLEPPKA